MNMNMTQNIDVNKIYPHPHNPRKDLGDLSELAESIRTKGILQNLTLVPRDDDTFFSVIGHRRHAAAKIAGIAEVPCIVSNMSEKEQIATMLLENIQRSDLTIYEQAQGFQMMLDLGETVNGIAEQTGFSETTVRRRVKLLELDQDKFEKATKSGATLMDFAELEKIEDVDLRNEVLEQIGTPNFKWHLQKAIEKEENARNMVVLLEKVNAFATKIENNSGMRYIQMCYAKNHEDLETPEDAGTIEYFYTISEQWGYITLYSQYPEKTEETTHADGADSTREEQNKIKAALDEATRRAYKLRYDFALGISNTAAKKNMAVIIEFALKLILDDSYYNFDFTDFANIYEIEKDEEEDEELVFNDILDQVRKQPEKSLLITVYNCLDSERSSYYDWNNRHDSNEDLDTVYEFLEKLGYEPSDEEKQLRDGSHELFVADEEES